MDVEIISIIAFFPDRTSSCRRFRSEDGRWFWISAEFCRCRLLIFGHATTSTWNTKYVSIMGVMGVGQHYIELKLYSEKFSFIAVFSRHYKIGKSCIIKFPSIYYWVFPTYWAATLNAWYRCNVILSSKRT